MKRLFAAQSENLFLLRRLAAALLDGLLGQRAVELAVLLLDAATLIDGLAGQRADPLCRVTVGDDRAAGDQTTDRRDDRQCGDGEQNFLLHGFSCSIRHFTIRSRISSSCSETSLACPARMPSTAHFST